MRADDIRKLQDAVPFRPFSLVLADGRAFRVPHPDFLSVSPKGTALSLWDEDGSIGGYLDTAAASKPVRFLGLRRGRRSHAPAARGESAYYAVETWSRATGASR